MRRFEFGQTLHRAKVGSVELAFLSMPRSLLQDAINLRIHGNPEHPCAAVH